MRWLDISLPEPGKLPALDAILADIRARYDALPGIQERDGLDASSTIHLMDEVGCALFQAVHNHVPDAFVPDHGPRESGPSGGDLRARGEAPAIGDAAHDDLTGFHLVVPELWRDLPWNWLHNSLRFVLEDHPICWSGRGSGLRDGDRGWMERLVRSRYLLDTDGNPSLRATLAQLRADGVRQPDLLFVAGHSEETIRRLMFREAEFIATALSGSPLGQALARFEMPRQAVTPTSLREQAFTYQAIHYAGPTSQPAALADLGDDAWLDRFLEDALATPDAEVAGAVGLEEVPVGIDQVTAVLDMVSERADRLPTERTAPAFGASIPTPGRDRSWLLDDGPVAPESLGRGAGLPPLIFSNSYRALPELGARFDRAGASTIVGPVAPLFSRPARRFAGHFYEALGAGWCAGAAVWRASNTLRQELGEDHPGWLSYGLQGYGSLALQYL